MTAIHDYECVLCNHGIEDQSERPNSCPSCGREGTMDITYKHWKSIAIEKGDNELTDWKGKRKAFTATEDPTASIELGLIDDPASRSLRTFSPEQAQEARNKLMTDGDSPKLRREILRTRANNEKEAGSPANYETI